MNTETQKVALKALNKQRNSLIMHMKNFRQNETNRKYMKQSHFSITIKSFKGEIKKLDGQINGLKEALQKSKVFGVHHEYDWKSNTVVPMTKTMYAVFDKSTNAKEELRSDLTNLISVFPCASDAIAEADITHKWDWCEIEVSVKCLRNV